MKSHDQVLLGFPWLGAAGDSGVMRTGITVDVTLGDRERLLVIAADRAEACLVRPDRAGTAAGCGTAAVMHQAGVAKTAAWRWQERFTQEAVSGLLRDKTRPSRIPPPAPEIAERVVTLTLGAPSGETTHWTAPAMAKQVGISVSSVQRIWRAHDLQPHRLRQFKLSNDPQFVARLPDIVGLYVNPPAHAVVLSVDEKSQIQALDRTQPGLPLKRRRGLFRKAHHPMAPARRVPLHRLTSGGHQPIPRPRQRRPPPLHWTTPTKIIAAVRRGHQLLTSTSSAFARCPVPGRCHRRRHRAFAARPHQSAYRCLLTPLRRLLPCPLRTPNLLRSHCWRSLERTVSP